MRAERAVTATPVPAADEAAVTRIRSCTESRRQVYGMVSGRGSLGEGFGAEPVRSG